MTSESPALLSARARARRASSRAAVRGRRRRRRRVGEPARRHLVGHLPQDRRRRARRGHGRGVRRGGERSVRDLLESGRARLAAAHARSRSATPSGRPTSGTSTSPTCMPVHKLGGSIGVQFGAALHRHRARPPRCSRSAPAARFTYADWDAGLTYARRFTDKLLIGVGGKYVHEDLGCDVGGPSLNTWLVDIGSIYYLGISAACASAMALSHFGPDFQPSGDFTSRRPARSAPTTTSTRRPRSASAWRGSRSRTETQRLTTSLEFDQPSDNQQVAQGRRRVRDRPPVRPAHRLQLQRRRDEVVRGRRRSTPTFGTTRGTLDYAYTDGGVLGAVHRVTLGVRF